MRNDELSIQSMNFAVSVINLAKDNGFHSETHGLPENFGGSVSIEYASGEKISFSNNQQPILSPNTGLCIKEFFSEAMKGEKVSLPDVSDLCVIRFSENRKNGGFTEATLTLKPDGTGENAKKSKYDGPEVYKSVKEVDKETVNMIKANMETTGILAWSNLPDSRYKSGNV